jgi:transcriptional regulator PpsR
LTRSNHIAMDVGSLPLVSPELLSRIVVSAADISLIVSSAFLVVSVLANPNHISFGRTKAWEGMNIRDVLTVESFAKFKEVASVVRLDGVQTRSVELNHVSESPPGGQDIPVKYTIHAIDAAGTMILIGRDLRPIAEAQQMLVNTQLQLERDYELQREGESRYRALMRTTRDALVLTSLPAGRIIDFNDGAAALLGADRETLSGAPLAQFLHGPRVGDLVAHVADVAANGSAQPVELASVRTGQKVQVSATVFRANRERNMLVRIDPAGGAAAVQAETAAPLNALYRLGPEGVVFTDAGGAIRAANEAFVSMCGLTGLPAMKGHSLGEYLARGSVDLRVLADNARRNGHVKVYSTRIITAARAEVAVEVSACWLGEQAAPVIGFVFRDAGPVDAIRRAGAGQYVGDGNRSIAELVGASSLRDIVAQTTDVIEKMCIETAVQMTGNNRVAAAEMLGLSRQSLYVKLRKFGLLNRDFD